jgi:Raf kinase inhibitor-like YbhB/YbcL family protein
MRKFKLIIIALIVVIGAVFVLAEKTAKNPEPLTIKTNSNMNITSPAFDNSAKIPAKYTCDGEGINPELIFSNIPENAKSLTLINHDPDAPKQGGWTHWIVINMTPSTTGIKENSKPVTGLETMTDSGSTGYGGPCPPSGSHRYIFDLYALDIVLNLDQTASKEDVETAMKSHILAKAELIGIYERQ